MFKTKLFAGICIGAATVTAAATALTLYLSGPSEVKTIHQYSPNEQVEMSLEGAFNSFSSTKEEITQFVDVISTNKTSANIGLTVNYIEGAPEVSGFGGNVEFQLDTEAQAAAVILSATLGSVDVIDGTVYVDKDELIAAVPVLYDGIIKAGLDNLVEDLENSYIGSYILEDMDIYELQQAFELMASDYETFVPQIEFDSEKFANGLSETLTKSYNNALSSMDLEDLGAQELNGGSYQCYNAKISVEDLSLILKDAIIYCMESSEFQDLVDQVLEYYEDAMGEPIPELEGLSGDMLGEYAGFVDAGWSQIISGVVDSIGENIEFKIYISDTVELAGLEFNMCPAGDKVSFNYKDAANAEERITLTLDFTGGKNIGDYTEIELYGDLDGEEATFNYTSKHETNGDFYIGLTADMPGESYGITAEGNFVQDGQFFNLDVESIKFIENGETLVDLGISCGFKPIDSISKPSGEPVYDIWEMEEFDFEYLMLEIEENLMEFFESME